MLRRLSYFWFIAVIEIPITLKTHQPNFNPFTNANVISTSIRIREGKVGKTRVENIRCGPEKNCIDPP